MNSSRSSNHNLNSIELAEHSNADVEASHFHKNFNLTPNEISNDLDSSVYSDNQTNTEISETSAVAQKKSEKYKQNFTFDANHSRKLYDTLFHQNLYIKDESTNKFVKPSVFDSTLRLQIKRGKNQNIKKPALFYFHEVIIFDKEENEIYDANDENFKLYLNKNFKDGSPLHKNTTLLLANNVDNLQRIQNYVNSINKNYGANLKKALDQLKNNRQTNAIVSPETNLVSTDALANNNLNNRSNTETLKNLKIALNEQRLFYYDPISATYVKPQKFNAELKLYKNISITGKHKNPKTYSFADAVIFDKKTFKRYPATPENFKYYNPAPVSSTILLVDDTKNRKRMQDYVTCCEQENKINNKQIDKTQDSYSGLHADSNTVLSFENFSSNAAKSSNVENNTELSISVVNSQENNNTTQQKKRRIRSESTVHETEMPISKQSRYDNQLFSSTQTIQNKPRRSARIYNQIQNDLVVDSHEQNLTALLAATNDALVEFENDSNINENPIDVTEEHSTIAIPVQQAISPPTMNTDIEKNRAIALSNIYAMSLYFYDSVQKSYQIPKEFKPDLLLQLQRSLHYKKFNQYLMKDSIIFDPTVNDIFPATSENFTRISQNNQRLIILANHGKNLKIVTEYIDLLENNIYGENLKNAIEQNKLKKGADAANRNNENFKMKSHAWVIIQNQELRKADNQKPDQFNSNLLLVKRKALYQQTIEKTWFTPDDIIFFNKRLGEIYLYNEENFNLLKDEYLKSNKLILLPLNDQNIKRIQYYVDLHQLHYGENLQIAIDHVNNTHNSTTQANSANENNNNNNITAVDSNLISKSTGDISTSLTNYFVRPNPIVFENNIGSNHSSLDDLELDYQDAMLIAENEDFFDDLEELPVINNLNLSNNNSNSTLTATSVSLGRNNFSLFGSDDNLNTDLESYMPRFGTNTT